MILRPATALLCIELLLANLTACGGNRVALPDIQPLSQVFLPLQDELNKSYGTLFEAAPKPEYSDGRRTRSATTGMKRGYYRAIMS
jgi:hypothetical protein